MASIFGIGIQTRFHGPTNYRGARVSAWATDRPGDGRKERVTIDYDHEHGGGKEPHEQAVREWVKRFGVSNGHPLFSGIQFFMVCAGIDDRGYLFTLVPHYAMPDDLSSISECVAERGES